ncbi:aminopeptidase P family protein [Streptomyces decoyicus]|uniref:Aminopeptidase P family protein n=1 Tax=Streptomyces decoyicus TaxID=249567 RepID=A0ABZ1FHU2_9ACTN|nr:aminopeptidase P family protein [Streptomyces decoyicus]WSB69604.1 aminopeptidase P family protein [Streptomyces decoyicus]
MTYEDYERRMDRAGRAAADAGLAGLIVTPGPDLVWLCGYRPPAATERLTALVIEPGRRSRLLVPVLEYPDAELSPGARALEVSGWTDGSEPYAEVAKWVDPQGRYGVSDATWALHLLGFQRSLPGTAYTALTEVLPMLRAVKDAHEVARLAAAGAAADATYEEILRVRFGGRRESEVAADLARLLTGHGHSQVDFTVVGSGPNGANPHHEAGERVIEDGDMVVLDFGGLKDGYGSDTSRTVHVGEPGAEERKVHDIVREAQQAAFEAVRPGVACQDIDRVARKIIKAAGYGEYFIHRTGHGIGVTTHEPPYLVEGEHLPLVPGMCFSIEPGIYLPGRFGVRIEDIVTCTDSGGRRLNLTAREMAVVR